MSKRIIFSTATENNYFCVYLLKAYSPVNHTGTPQGFSQVQNLHKSNNKIQVHAKSSQAKYNVHNNNKHKTHLKKKSIFGILLLGT